MQRKSTISCLRVLCIATVLSLFVTQSAFSGENDPILDFYWAKAAQSAKALLSDSVSVGYQIRALSYHHRLDKRGRITSTDSLLAEYYYSSGVFDSLTVIAGIDNEMTRADFSVLDIFSRPYLRNLFPNDTGGVELAIGFDSDTTHLSDPIGIVIIDRYQYFPIYLYTNYPDSAEFRRYSRSYRFTVQDGFLYPDSIWVSASRQALFTRENYRLETGVQSLLISHPKSK